MLTNTQEAAQMPALERDMQAAKQAFGLSQLPKPKPSISDLRGRAVKATLVALIAAAERHDHAAVSSLSAALRILEGGS